jgi:hypothetical protein
MMSPAMHRAYEVAKQYDQTLLASDPRFNFCVRILHEEGTSYWFVNAFLMQWDDASVVHDPKNAAERQGEWLMVFTEHQSFHVFAFDDLLAYNQYTQSAVGPEMLFPEKTIPEGGLYVEVVPEPEVTSMNFKIDIENAVVRKEQIQAINEQLERRFVQGGKAVPIKRLATKLVEVSEYYTPLVTHALEERLKIVEAELVVLLNATNRELTVAERMQLPESLRDLPIEELEEQVDPWITLRDSIKDLMEQFKFLKEV